MASLPSRECGLKFGCVDWFLRTARVTPLAGVWIEIHKQAHLYQGGGVTPLAGVWIEIPLREELNLKPYRHSPRGSVD